MALTTLRAVGTLLADKEGVYFSYSLHLHYCVTNMPGAYPWTSTIALTDATLPYVQKLVAQSIEALLRDEGFVKGVNAYQGYVTCELVAEVLDLLLQSRAFTAID